MHPIKVNTFKRISNLFLVVVFLFGAFGFILADSVFASINGILDTRSIRMSTSANGATNVQYTVTYNYGTSPNQTLGGLVIEFCTQDPIPGDSCSTPGTTSNFNVNSGTAGIINSQTGVTGWAVDTSHSTQRAMILNRTPSSVTSGTTQTLVFGDGSSKGFTNPTYTTCGSPSTGANCTFYARIYTFTANITTTWNSTSPGAYTDYGGIALSVNAQLVINAKVQEQLSLCIYVSSCTSGVSPITLGDANGILSSAHSYTNVNGKFDASTNASGGMKIYGAGSTLTSPQGNTIAAIGSTAQASSTGNEQFGFCISTSGGSVTAASLYNGGGACGSVTTGADAAGSATFAFDSSNLGALGGQIIASSTGPSTTTTGTLAFLANIAVTTKAGAYTTTMTFVGVGTF